DPIGSRRGVLPVYLDGVVQHPWIFAEHYFPFNAEIKGALAARIAGREAPIRPIAHAQRIPSAMSLLLTRTGTASCVRPPASVLTTCPPKNNQARPLPITLPAIASNNASVSTAVTMGTGPKPRTRNVAISTVRALTAVYMVLSAPNTAPMAMIPLTR